MSGTVLSTSIVKIIDAHFVVHTENWDIRPLTKIMPFEEDKHYLRDYDSKAPALVPSLGLAVRQVIVQSSVLREVSRALRQTVSKLPKGPRTQGFVVEKDVGSCKCPYSGLAETT